MISETIEFPVEFNNIHPEEYELLLPDILDFLMKTQRSNDRSLYFQTITKINEIVANMSYNIDKKLYKIILNEITSDNVEKSALLLMLVNEIKSHKKIVYSKFYLNTENAQKIQYPTPVTLKLLEILSAKENFILKFVKMLE
jgi:hypothetical protein